MNRNRFCPDSEPISLPLRMIQAFGRLQSELSCPAASSVYIYDLVEQQTICASYSVAAMLGYHPDAIHNMGPVGLATLIHPDDLSQVSEHYQQFATLLYGEVISIEYRMKHSDGTWCRLRSRETSLVQAVDGFPLQILGIIQIVKPNSENRSRTTAFLRQTARKDRFTRRVKIASAR